MTFRHRLEKRRFRLGEELVYYSTPVIFVRSTCKGFNFFIPSRNRFVFRRHLYDPKFSNQLIPPMKREFQVWITDAASSKLCSPRIS